MKLGPYTLHERIGRGGMGEVWRGQDTRWRVPVAVKVLGESLDGAAAAALTNELKTVSTLHHPGIVRLLGHGRVRAPAPNGLLPGAPYLAMELIDGGTLGRERGAISWPRLRRVLLQLLDALAHAHAHGVVHRDLKPSNILRDRTGKRVVLCDFGLAGLLDAGARTEDIKGTPAYMAPEQVVGAWREQGPWTDLYSLGCTAWCLATGDPPFGSGLVAERHLRERPGPFVAGRPMPPAFEQWLRRLLKKTPRHRYDRAAEAAWALSRIPVPEGTDDFEPATLIGEVPQEHTASPDEGPPLPADWRATRTQRDALTITARRGMVGGQGVELVGREAERDALWAAFHQVDATDIAQVVLLRGPTGIGKSRLAEWLCARSHELGASTVLLARHLPDEDVGPGQAVARSVQGLELDRKGLRQRIDAHLPQLDPEDRTALVELALPGAGPPSERVATGKWRRAVLRRWLAALCEERAVVLWLDDLQWGPESVELAASLHGTDLPVLVVGTVNEDALVEPLTIEGATELVVPALDRDELYTLAYYGLGLSTELAGRIGDRTAGNPSFAIQLVSTLMDQNLLVVGENGLQLVDGASLELPDELARAWVERLATITVDWPQEQLHGVEILAVLGTSASLVQARAAWAQAGLQPPDDAIDSLCARHLASMEPGRFHFAHGMLREALLRQAGDRLRDWHAAAADALHGMPGDDVLQARARHLVGAGRLRESLEPLMQAHRQLRHSERYPAAAAVLRLREGVLEDLDLDPLDPLRGEQMVAECELLFRTTPMAFTRRRVEELRELAWENGWHLAAGRATHLMGLIHNNQGEVREAIPNLRAAGRVYRRLDMEPQALQLSVDLADALTACGELKEAEQGYRDAIAALDDDFWMGRARVGLALCRRQQGDLDESVALLMGAKQVWERCGHRWGEAVVLNDLADIARVQGRLEEAERAFVKASHRMAMLGFKPLVPEINLGLVRGDQGRHSEALATLKPLREYLEVWGRKNWTLHIRTAELRSLAALGRRSDFDACLEATERLIEEEGLVDEEMARFLEEAAAQADWPSGRRAAALAQNMRTILGS